MENKAKMQKVTSAILKKERWNSFSVIGDPGCEGLGTTMMQVYADALSKTSQNDCTLIVGDLVPVGEKGYYHNICNLTNSIAQKEVYVLRGNHDTGDYTQVFGLYDYAIIGNNFTLVIIDNAFRIFSEEGLVLLKEILKKEECKNVVIAFHIPIPNHFTSNTVSEEEFQKLRSIYLPWKSKIKYFICGHVHSYFEDKVDEIPLICTGGGGAMIEDVSENIKASDIEHHIISFVFENNQLNHQFIALNKTSYKKEITNSIIHNQVMGTIEEELLAHLHYLTFAERAKRRGYEEIANLFFALAESEYRHAHSFFALLDQSESFGQTIETFIPKEEFEYQKMYKMISEYAKEQMCFLTAQAYQNAAAAEKIHAKLLEEAKDIEQFKARDLYICPVCGFIIEEEIDRCPVCGAPKKQFVLFSTSKS